MSEALSEALREAERFIAYYSGETDGCFVGTGTPSKCLEQIRAALAAYDAAPEWTPPEDREDGYRCLGWMLGRWDIVTWEAPYWDTGISSMYPTAFAPLPQEPTP